MKLERKKVDSKHSVDLLQYMNCERQAAMVQLVLKFSRELLVTVFFGNISW